MVSFEYQPNVQASTKNEFRSIIHFTIGGDGWYNDKGVCGSRYPAIWTRPNTNDELHFTSCVNDNASYHKTSKIEDKWNSIEIGQTKRVNSAGNEIFYFFIKLNGNIFHETINSNPKEITDLKVYASDPWWVAANGYIKNLVAKNSASQSKPLHFFSGLITNKCLS